MHPHPNIHPYKLSWNNTALPHCLRISTKYCLFFSTKHKHHSSPTLIWKWDPLLESYLNFYKWTLDTLVQMCKKRKNRLLWTRTQYWFFCGAVKHLHSIWLLSKPLFNSWSQIALFTARALVKWTISILTIHYSNGTLPHKLLTWWIPYVND